ncbi:MAG: hypothetical protein KatS3mg111_4255 [Pirellulaceae bacterium]|nr:MAG: hypothetical protein KatS3mg111_4255 [Pirellulaceae bacterium]
MRDTSDSFAFRCPPGVMRSNDFRAISISDEQAIRFLRRRQAARNPLAGIKATVRWRDAVP